MAKDGQRKSLVVVMGFNSPVRTDLVKGTYKQGKSFGRTPGYKENWLESRLGRIR